MVEWHCVVDECHYGPMQFSELRELYEDPDNSVDCETFVWSPFLDDAFSTEVEWESLAQCKCALYVVLNYEKYNSQAIHFGTNIRERAMMT
jgi:hypothetical protein